MSHVATVQTKITDVDALGEAAAKLGGELMRDQKQFRFYGGQTSPCIHAIRLKGAKANAYEIGLRWKSATDQSEGFTLNCDFYDGSLTKAFGANLVGLQNEYQAVVAENFARRRGYRVVSRDQQAQEIRLVLQR